MLYDRKSLNEIIQSQETWTREELQKVLDRSGERLERFSTISDMEIPRLSTPVDNQDFDYQEKLGLPGDFPFTRGVYPTMYRGRL